jgi:hypothetical protein
LYSSKNNTRENKLKKVTWTGQVARMEEIRNMHKILVGDLGVDWRIVLRRNLRKYDVRILV